MRIRLVSLLVIPALAFAACCNAATFRFDDVSEIIAVSMDGAALTGNGGRITNFTLGAESVSFDVSTNGINFITTTDFTQLLEPVNSDGQPNTVSDIYIQTFTANADTYHVAFSSDPESLVIPPGARDLTTVPEQGLPHPYYEDGTFQKVSTVFGNQGVLDTYFVRSDVPEPAPALVFTTGLVVLLAYGWRQRKKVA